MVASIFLRGLCEYIWVNILTLSPCGADGKGGIMMRKLKGRIDKGGHSDVQMKRWMVKWHYDVQIKRVDG